MNATEVSNIEANEVEIPVKENDDSKTTETNHQPQEHDPWSGLGYRNSTKVDSGTGYRNNSIFTVIGFAIYASRMLLVEPLYTWMPYVPGISPIYGQGYLFFTNAAYFFAHSRDLSKTHSKSKQAFWLVGDNISK